MDPSQLLRSEDGQDLDEFDAIAEGLRRGSQWETSNASQMLAENDPHVPEYGGYMKDMGFDFGDEENFQILSDKLRSGAYKMGTYMVGVLVVYVLVTQVRGR